MWEPRPLPSFHRDPYNPVLYSSEKLEVSPEQERLIRDLLLVCSSDTRFAQKAADALRLILTAGSTQTPQISSINPESMPVQSPQFRLTCTGTGFDPTCSIWLNGNPRVTLFTSETEVYADVDTLSLNEAIDVSVIVRTGSGAISNNVAFHVTALSKEQQSKIDKYHKDLEDRERKEREKENKEREEENKKFLESRK